MNRNIFKITICSALILASCAKDEQAEGIHSQEQDLHTVTVNFNMPDGKPGFGEISDTKSSADSLFTVEVIPATRAVTGGWGDGDVMLMEISAGSTQARLKLEYTGAGYWTLDKYKSYVKYTGDTFTSYKQLAVPLFVGDTQEDDFQIDPDEPLTMNIDWKSEVTAPTVKYIYAPQMEWSIAEGVVTLISDAATPEKWTKTDNNSWTTSLARLRVNTGTGNAGDKVTLTSSAFTTALGNSPAGNRYTAFTDEDGNVYFYGMTPDALTDDFTIELTAMSVPVDPSLLPEGNLVITPGSPIVLFEATQYNPVKLEKSKAYKILAEARRDTEVNESLSVIDGAGTDPDIIKAQIVTAVEEDITEFTVINQLAVSSSIAGSVVGSAISQLVSGQITLTLEDATDVPEGAFRECHALKQVSVPMAESIGEYAFYYCTALTDVNLPMAESIDTYAFGSCTALNSVSLPAAKSIDAWAFEGCTSLTEINLPKATSIGNSAFKDCTGLTDVNLPMAESIDTYAFGSCTALNRVSLPKATSIGNSAFKDCTGLTKVTFGAVLTNVDNEAFNGLTTTNCALTLHANQQAETSTLKVTAENGKLMWAGKQWKSITVGEIELKAVGNELYMLIADDGNLAYPEAWGGKIITAIGNYNLAGVYVTGNRLSIYYGNAAKRTVVGEAILSLGNYGESYNGRISLVLEAAEIPANAFSGCYALRSVVANSVTTIGIGAFYECTQITAITFGTVITEVGNYTFDQMNQQVEPWTMSCDLTLGAGSVGDPDVNSKTWANCTWKSITLN